jgi:hypothetical protein
VRAAVVAGMDAPPVLEASEHVLDLVALAIEGFVVGDRDLAVGFGWDARGDALGDQGLTEPVGVVTPIAEHGPGLGQGVQHQSRALVVAHLAFGEQHNQGPPIAVADGMELRVQPAFSASDTSGNSPFLSRLAAVRWALR